MSDLIINGGSSMNIVAQEVVDKERFPIKKKKNIILPYLIA